MGEHTDLSGRDGAGSERDLAAELERTQRSLRESEARFRLLMRSIVDYAIIGTDLSGAIVLWNEPAARITGWSAREMIGQSLDSIFTPEDREAGLPWREAETALAEGSARAERWHLRRDGSHFFASGELMPMRDDAGTTVGFLKILRDHTQERLRRRELELSRERLQFALEASDLVGTWDWHLASDTIFGDERFSSLYGLDPAEAADGLPIERYLDGIAPADRPTVAEAITRAVEDGANFDLEYRTLARDGKRHWVRARGRCFHDAEGRPERFPGAVVDITREKMREQRQAALLRLGDETAGFAERGGFVHKALRILGETLDMQRVGYASLDADEEMMTQLGQWADNDAAALPAQMPIRDFGGDLVSALRNRLVVVSDVANDPVTRDGLATWQRLGTGSMVGMSVVEEGRVRVLLYLHAQGTREWDPQDIDFIQDVLNRAWNASRRHAAERALLDTETRLRMAQEAAEIGTFDLDTVKNELLWDRRCRQAFGISSSDDRVDLALFESLVHPEDRGRVKTAVERTLDPASDGSYNITYRTLGREDGRLRHIHATGQTVVENGRTLRFVGAVRDITQTREAEQRQILLTRELQHRVKNTLAMVSALANQTMRRAPTAQEGLNAFSARLIALSHAHDILTQTSWTSAPLGALVAQTLATYQTGAEERIHWSGPDVRLTAKQSLALALGLHELATNASKYGALSVESGRVEVRWTLEPAADEQSRELRLWWRETNGPAVVPPTRRGFGSRLIEQSLALEFGGTVEMDFAPTGLVCTIEAPLPLDLGEAAFLPLTMDEG